MIDFSPRRWLLVPSLGVALLLTLLPLPEWASELRPPWVALTLLYWILAAPERVGVFWGWAMGLLLDVSIGTILGQHALSLAVMAWLMVSQGSTCRASKGETRKKLDQVGGRS